MTVRRQVSTALCAIVALERQVSEVIMKNYKGYQWVVSDPDLLGGKPTIRGTRISVAQVLACLAESMTPHEIAEDYPGFPEQSVLEALRFAAEQIEKLDPDVAA